MAYAKAKEVPLMESTAFRMTTSKGIFEEVDNHRLLCGSEKFLTENEVSIDNKVQSALEQLRTQGKASILIAEGQKCIGVIALSDVLRPEAKDKVFRLSDMHTRTVLLTGDHQKTADHFAQQIGISEVRAELLPEKKCNVRRFFCFCMSVRGGMIPLRACFYFLYRQTSKYIFRQNNKKMPKDMEAIKCGMKMSFAN